MNFAEAVKSKLPFRRKGEDDLKWRIISLGVFQYINGYRIRVTEKDMRAKDYEVKQ